MSSKEQEQPLLGATASSSQAQSSSIVESNIAEPQSSPDSGYGVGKLSIPMQYLCVLVLIVYFIVFNFRLG